MNSFSDTFLALHPLDHLLVRTVRSLGEFYVDGHRPDEWRHVFASVQSLAQLDRAHLRPDAFDIVIVENLRQSVGGAAG